MKNISMVIKITANVYWLSFGGQLESKEMQTIRDNMEIHLKSIMLDRMYFLIFVPPH